MPSRLAWFGTAMAIAVSPAFAADDAPRWEIGEICASSNLGAQCPRIESQNRSTLLLRWGSIPAQARTACIASVEGSGKPSYKLMLNCIEEQQLKALEHSDAAGHRQKDS